MSFISSQFWKFVITGAENNTELKVWSCVDWACLQTIKFAPDYMSKKSRVGCYLKAGLDFGARHLVLTDIYNQVSWIYYLIFCAFTTRLMNSRTGRICSSNSCGRKRNDCIHYLRIRIRATIFGPDIRYCGRWDQALQSEQFWH